MKQYEVKTKFMFTGTFIVNAESKEEAKRDVEKNCGLVLGGNVQTSLSDAEVPDWDFPVHPEKIIIRIKEIQKWTRHKI
jgi:hypothetical protein